MFSAFLLQLDAKIIIKMYEQHHFYILIEFVLALAYQREWLATISKGSKIFVTLIIGTKPSASEWISLLENSSRVN